MSKLDKSEVKDVSLRNISHAERRVVPDFAGRVLYFVIVFFMWVFSHTYVRCKTRGASNIGRRGPVIFAPVHRSYIDPVLLGGVIRRRVRVMAKEELWVPVIGQVLNRTGLIPVRRNSKDRQSVAEAIEALKAGEALLIFPEGTRRDGDIIADLHDGLGYLAGKTGCPVIPVGIDGSDNVMPAGARFIYPRKVNIFFGEPVLFQANAPGRPTREEVKHFTRIFTGALQSAFDHSREMKTTS